MGRKPHARRNEVAGSGGQHSHIASGLTRTTGNQEPEEELFVASLRDHFAVKIPPLKQFKERPSERVPFGHRDGRVPCSIKSTRDKPNEIAPERSGHDLPFG